MGRWRRRSSKTKRAAESRPWCPTCGYTRRVPGPPVTREDGRVYSTVTDCPDCRIAPPVKLAPGQLPLDAQQRAAGERGE